MTLDEKIALFFKEPTENETGMEHSVLHMARREIQDCFIGALLREDDVVAQSLREKHRLFATVMVIMAATDLLAEDVRWVGQQCRHRGSNQAVRRAIHVRRLERPQEAR
jgi:hypothetical protein